MRKVAFTLALALSAVFSFGAGEAVTLGISSAVRAVISAKPLAEQVEKATFDWSIPVTPAFNVLGVSPEDIERPATLRDLYYGLISSVDKDGKLRQGVAIATSGWHLGLSKGKDFNQEKYAANADLRRRLNSQFSFATSMAGESDSNEVRVGLGFYYPLENHADPFSDPEFVSKRKLFFAKNALPELKAPTPPRRTDSTALWEAYAKEVEKYEGVDKPAYEEKRAELLGKFYDTYWNKKSSAISIAPSWISADGNGDNLKWNGGGVWYTMAVPAGQNGQFLAVLKGRWEELVESDSKKGGMVKQDSYGGGLRYYFGQQDRAGSITLTYTSAKADGSDRREFTTFLAKYEFRVSKDQWLLLSYGDPSREGSNSTRSVLGVAIQWSTSPKRTMSTKP